MSLVKTRRFGHICRTHPGGGGNAKLLGLQPMTDPNSLLMTMVNALLVLVLAAILVTPMVFFFAALIGAPVMLCLLVIITLTTRAKAPMDTKKAAAA